FSSRRRHTRSKRDWSSDVCSSDLVLPVTKSALSTVYNVSINSSLKSIASVASSMLEQALSKKNNRHKPTKGLNNFRILSSFCLFLLFTKLFWIDFCHLTYLK